MVARWNRKYGFYFWEEEIWNLAHTISNYDISVKQTLCRTRIRSMKPNNDSKLHNNMTNTCRIYFIVLNPISVKGKSVVKTPYCLIWPSRWISCEFVIGNTYIQIPIMGLHVFSTRPDWPDVDDIPKITLRSYYDGHA